MPLIIGESKSVEHSWPTKHKYAQSAKAHRQVIDQAEAPCQDMDRATTTLLIMAVVALALVAIIACALLTTPVG